MKMLAQLAAGGDTSSAPSTLPAETVQQLAGNTIAVMTEATDQRDAWREVLQSNRDEWSTRGDDYAIEVAFADALLAILKGEAPTLPDDNPYAGVVQRVQQHIEQYRKDNAE